MAGNTAASGLGPIPSIITQQGNVITGSGAVIEQVQPTINNPTFAAGTTLLPTQQFTSGSNLTTAVAGAYEYDGVNSYLTNETTSGRGIIPTQQFFRLAANGSSITGPIANFFGSNSNVSLVSGGFIRYM